MVPAKSLLSRRWGPPAVVVAAFGAAHAVYYALGVRFDASPLAWFWQFLDAPLLQRRLGESLLYLHSQPPLFNLFLGATLKATNGAPVAWFQAFYLLCGLALAAGIYSLQTRLGVGRTVAAIATAAFVLSPSFVLYEHWLFYTFPLAAAGVWAAVALHAALERGRLAAWVAFFALLFVLCGTWHVFHLAFYVVAAVGAALAAAGARRKVLVAASTPFLLLAAWYGKNAVLVGEFTASTWNGMVLWSMAGRYIPYNESLRLEEEGALTPVAFVPTFSPLSAYPPPYAEVPSRYRGVAALAAPTKSTGPPNFNHYGYVAVSRAYMKDFLYVVRRHPGVYARALGRSWFTYFQSTADYEAGVSFLNENGNLDRVKVVNSFFDYAVYGKVPWSPYAAGEAIGGDERVTPRSTYVLLIVIPALAMVGAAALALRRRSQSPLAHADRFVILFMCLTTAYLALATNATAWVETNRMRFQTDPYAVVLATVCVQYYLVRRRVTPK